MDEHGEVDDGDSGGDEHGLQGYVFRIYEKHQSERHRATQTTIGHHKLLHFVQFVEPELVRQRREHYHAWSTRGQAWLQL